MVLWEITLGTAYFLGLKRTYRLALKIQRRVISPKHPKIRQFAHRRTRAVFDVALKFHKRIQERDIEAGRNLGNWILRWLDKMKPSAEIRGKPPPHGNANTNTNTSRQLTGSSNQKNSGNFQKFDVKSSNGDSNRHLFTSSRNAWPKSFPTVARTMRPTKPTGSNIHYRHFSVSQPGTIRTNHGGFGYEGLIRKDIMQWIRQN